MVSDPDSITVQATLNFEDYLRYSDVAKGRHADPVQIIIYSAAFFAAIPAALIFRWLSFDWADDPADADLVGKLTLLAFLLGAAAMVVAMSLIWRHLVRRSISETPNAFSSKIATFDQKGVTLAGQISEASWQWAAVTRLTVARGLLLIWVGPTVAMIVPTRHFESDAARDLAIAFIRARIESVEA